MKRINKYYIILPLVVVLFLAVVGLVYKSSLRSSPEEVKKNIVSRFSVSEGIQESLPITISDNVSYSQASNKGGIFTLSETTVLNDEFVYKIVNSLGFTTDPIVSSDPVQGKVYIWNSDSNSLVAYPKLRKIKYSPSIQARNIILTAPNKQLTDQDLINIGKKFLNEKMLVENSDFQFNNLLYYMLENSLEGYRITDKEQSQLYHVNFSPLLNNVPIITTNPNNSTMYVEITKDGKILNAEVVYLNKPKEFGDPSPLLNLGGIRNNLSSAVLISINDGNYILEDLNKDDIKNITVYEITEAYLLDNIANFYIKPVFVLKGTIDIEGENQLYNAILYLQAIKN